MRTSLRMLLLAVAMLLTSLPIAFCDDESSEMLMASEPQQASIAEREEVYRKAAEPQDVAKYPLVYPKQAAIIFGIPLLLLIIPAMWVCLAKGWQDRMGRVVIFVLLLSVTVLVASAVYGSLSALKDRRITSEAQDRMSAIRYALRYYAEAHESKFPPKSSWMAAVLIGMSKDALYLPPPFGSRKAERENSLTDLEYNPVPGNLQSESRRITAWQRHPCRSTRGEGRFVILADASVDYMTTSEFLERLRDSLGLTEEAGKTP